ncbi:MAG: SOS response-associated peptidase [Actinobacteria bacterium]|nr:SOS response-associated peptidase [Actinomycetota bacterium]
MCGRYALSQGADDLALEFETNEVTPTFLPADWNIAPTKEIYFISSADALGAKRRVGTALWGLIPSWSKDARGASQMINARIETVSEKPSFRVAFRSRRCIVPADGYYEWATQIGPYRPKQPFFISHEDGSLLAMAGIFEEWINPRDGKRIVSAAILTRESVGEISTIHHRMPLILPSQHWSRWLSSTPVSEGDVRAYLALLDLDDPAQGLRARPVSTAVNSARNSGPDLTREVELGEPETLF